MSTPNLSCCSSLAIAPGIAYLAGHHPACPRFGLAAIGERARWDADHYVLCGTAGHAQAHADRAVLLAAVKELQARVAAEEAGRADALRWLESEKPSGQVIEGARAALRPTGTLASLPPDACDGGDR